MKYGFIQAHAHEHAIGVMCRVLRVSRSGYYDWRDRPESARCAGDRELLVHIRRLHIEARQAYGAVKTWRGLTVQGIACGKHRVARLRRMHDIQARRRRRFKASTYARVGRWAAPDLVRRDFRVDAPNRVWVGDVTFIETRAGWLHLAVLLDLYSRRVIGWSMSERNDVQLALAALQMALAYREPAPGLIHHSDRGAVYRSGEYRQLLETHGAEPSMGRKGDCWDNAVAESFFSTLKNELVHGMRFTDRDHARREIVSFMEGFYNRMRIHETLGYVSPVSFEQQVDVA